MAVRDGARFPIRTLAVLATAVLVAGILVAVLGLGPDRRVPLPGVLLASGTNFGLTGSISNLAPGVSSPLSVTASNPYSVGITVNTLTVSLPSTPVTGTDGATAAASTTISSASLFTLANQYAGWSITDSLGAIPSGTIITAEAAGTSHNATISQPASATKTGDKFTLTAVPPTCPLSNLTVDNIPFSAATGTPPTYSVSLTGLSQVVPAGGSAAIASAADGATTMTSPTISSATLFTSPGQFAGWFITDSAGAIPAGTTITSETAGTGHNATISQAAGSTTSTDRFTLSPPILISRAAGNGCQNVAFPFTYSATAAYTATTKTVLVDTPNPSTFGQPVTLTATVSPSVTPDPGSAIPTGSVTFVECTHPASLANNSLASSCTAWTALSPAETLVNGQASFSISSLAIGSYALFAMYSPQAGSTDFSQSASNTVTQTVNPTTPCIVTTVNGSYTVKSGQSICVNGPGRVNGGVTVQSGGALSLNGATVNGGVTSTGATAIRICGSTINGGVSASGTTGFIMIGDGGDDGLPGCAANSISGGVNLSSNQGGFEVAGNSKITGGATFTSNSGAGPTVEDAAPEVEGNSISGSLSCTFNSPAPTADHQTNTVSGSKSGQCAVGF